MYLPRCILFAPLISPLRSTLQICRIAVLEEDRERLVQNYDELQEFALQDTVTVDGVTMKPQWGPTKSGPRPVLRLPVSTRSPVPEGWSSERIFTRVVPGAKHTSMLVHVRQGCVNPVSSNQSVAGPQQSDSRNHTIVSLKPCYRPSNRTHIRTAGTAHAQTDLRWPSLSHGGRLLQVEPSEGCPTEGSRHRTPTTAIPGEY